MFSMNGNTNFQVTCPNGLTVSVGIGNGHYCSRRAKSLTEKMQEMTSPPATVTSQTAEVAVFDTDGKIMRVEENQHGIISLEPGGNDAQGWMSVVKFSAILQAALTYSPPLEKGKPEAPRPVPARDEYLEGIMNRHKPEEG